MRAVTNAVKVAIIGAGNVGTTTAYALLLSGLASEIVLVDINRAKCEGEAMDLSHSQAFVPSTRIHAGEFPDCNGASIVVLAAGMSQKAGQGRLDLLQSNASIFREIVPEVVRHAPDAILLVATNPVDPLTYATWKLSGLPPNQVMGSGTILDSARFRYLLGLQFGINPQSVHAYIIGEHGDSEVPLWSLANVAGIRLRQFCEREGIAHDEQRLHSIFHQTRDAAYEIIRRKGGTEYAIASGLVRIMEAILRDDNSILTISSVVEHYGIVEAALSLPTRVNRRGADHVLQLPLDEQELANLVRSAEIIRTATAAMDLEREISSKGGRRQIHEKKESNP